MDALSAFGYGPAEVCHMPTVDDQAIRVGIHRDTLQTNVMLTFRTEPGEGKTPLYLTSKSDFPVAGTITFGLSPSAASDLGEGLQRAAEKARQKGQHPT